VQSYRRLETACLKSLIEKSELASRYLASPEICKKHL